MTMPTETDLKLAEDLAAFRLESERRSGAIEKALAEFRGEFHDLRGELRWIKTIGAFIVALMVSLAAGAVPIIWNAATIASEVRQDGRRLDQMEARFERIEGRLDRVEKRLDSIDGKLDVLLRRGEANAAAKG